MNDKIAATYLHGNVSFKSFFFPLKFNLSENLMQLLSTYKYQWTVKLKTQTSTMICQYAPLSLIASISKQNLERRRCPPIES